MTEALPETAAVEDFLVRVHAADPGGTPRLFGAWCTEDGRSSYQVLMDQLAPAGTPRVLDLACGDGYLIEGLRERAPGLVALGVDLSPAELLQGRARLGAAAGVLLVRGRAQALPLEDACVDAVVSHMALMLMPEIEAVLAEVARVLRPGGRLLAVVGTGTREAAFYPEFLARLRAAREAEGVPPCRLGDPRTRELEGLRRLLLDVTGLRDFRSLDFTVGTRGTPEEIWAAVGEMYDVLMLSPEGRARVREEMLEALRARHVEADGRVPCRFGLRLVSGVRQGRCRLDSRRPDSGTWSETV